MPHKATQRQALEAVQPADGAFDLPAVTRQLQLVFEVRRKRRTVVAVRADEFDEPILQAAAQRVAVISATTRSSEPLFALTVQQLSDHSVH